MSDEALLELVFHGREERNLEYKQSMSWADLATRAKIAKSSMAMANLPDGGAIVIGVRKSGEVYEPVGMGDDDMESFKQDDVMDWVNGYADPSVEITVRTATRDKSDFVVIQIKEFAQLPVICKKNGIEGLRKGALFTRSKRKYETAEVSGESEMREILDLAVDKEIRRLRSRGLLVFGEAKVGGPPRSKYRLRSRRLLVFGEAASSTDMGPKAFERQLGSL